MASHKPQPQGLFDGRIIAAAALDAVRKLDPRALAKNPVIFVTEVVSAVVTLLFVRDLVAHNGQACVFRPDRRLALVHRAVRQFRRGGRRGARQGAGRRAAQDAHRHARPGATSTPRTCMAPSQVVNAHDLKLGDVVLVEAGEIIPGDGEILEGVASVNESAITGESAPVIREAGGDRSAVTGGTTVLSDYIKVKITAAPGSTFIDRMIALVEGAERQKTPNELALSILLSGLTLIFLIVCVTLWPIAKYSGTELSATVLIALLVCLIPDDHRRPPVRHRHRRHGPADPLQRDRHLRARGRGRGRRRYAAARQDRHDHLRKPHGDRVPAGRRRPEPRISPRPRSPRASPTKRRRADRSWRSPRATTDCPSPISIPPRRKSCRSPPRPAFPASTSAPARSARARSTRSCAI